jgi:hypothetical protein
MTPRLARAAVSMLVLASAAGAASATVTEYTDQTVFSAAISGATTLGFDGLTPPGTVSFGGVTLGGLSFTGSDFNLPAVVGAGSPYHGGSAFFTSLSPVPGIFEAEVLCTLAGSNAIGFLYGDLGDENELPFTVTLSTGDSFELSMNPGSHTGFIGFVSDTAITSVSFSDDGESFDVLEVVKSSPGTTGVPEPAPLGLMATGLLALAVLAHRRRAEVAQNR